MPETRNSFPRNEQTSAGVGLYNTQANQNDKIFPRDEQDSAGDEKQFLIHGRQKTSGGKYAGNHLW